MKVDNYINQTGKINIGIQIFKNNKQMHIAYKYGEIGGITKVYQAWLVDVNTNYVIEDDKSKILLEIDNISFQLKKRWANQGKSVSHRLNYEEKLDIMVSQFKE